MYLYDQQINVFALYGWIVSYNEYKGKHSFVVSWMNIHSAFHEAL